MRSMKYWHECRSRPTPAASRQHHEQYTSSLRAHPAALAHGHAQVASFRFLLGMPQGFPVCKISYNRIEGHHANRDEVVAADQSDAVDDSPSQRRNDELRQVLRGKLHAAGCVGDVGHGRHGNAIDGCRGRCTQDQQPEAGDAVQPRQRPGKGQAEAAEQGQDRATGGEPVSVGVVLSDSQGP
eukprot:UN3224